ncbi:transposase, partial [Burkholderia cenocepacia]
TQAAARGPLPDALRFVFSSSSAYPWLLHLMICPAHKMTDRSAVAAALKEVYRAPTAEAAAVALDAFDAGAWGAKYPPIAALWRRAWEQVIPFYVFAPDIRKIIYTTNAIESLHMQLRKIIKARGHFPSDEAALKLIWLALRNVVAKWTGSRHDWKSAMTQFALLYPERFNIGI